MRSTRRRAFAAGCLVAFIAIIAGLIGSPGEQALLWLSLLLMAGAIGLPTWRADLGLTACLLLIAAQILLAAHLLLDDFTYRYVWLYSAPELPAYLKLVNLWGGEEGTLLLLATLFAIAALRLLRWRGQTAAFALLMAMAFVAAALIWSPFAPTPEADLDGQGGLGMNAHLASPWMALHPPLIFGAYALLIAPVGGALEALLGRESAWPERHGNWLRAGWLIISSGLVVGMWWAYEDFTYGQFWHWDPVQTSVFVVWALATAQLHGLTRYRWRGHLRRIQPLLAGLTAVAALLSMTITRSPDLASSHRYVGDSSLPLLMALAITLLAALITTLILGWRAHWGGRSMRLRSTDGLLLIVTIGLSLAALIAALEIAYAYAGAYQDWPRPASLKPFFETLSRWSTPDELHALRAAFDQWEIDRYAMNAWLAPVLALLTLAGGHAFSPVRMIWLRWSISIAVALIAGLVAWKAEPMAALFDGTGMTSSATRAIFPWLDALAVTTLYLASTAMSAIMKDASRAITGRSFWGYALPIGIIHVGVALALIAGTAATVFDSYAQRLVRYPDEFGKPIAFADGFTVTVWLDDMGPVDDGARGSFRAVGRVGWELAADGAVVQAEEGHAVYRDDRATAAGDKGPVRLMCEILDYRYARYVSGDSEMIHPFIHRGLWRDVQVWLPAIDVDQADEEVKANASEVPVVLKVFPLMAWFWAGLVMILIGAAIRLMAKAVRPHPRRLDPAVPES